MRALAVWLSLVCCALTPAGANAASDDPINTLVGTWTCGSARGSDGTWTYTRQTDGTIILVVRFTATDGAHGEFNELYRHDDTANRWIWTGRDRVHTQLREEGSAPDEWTGNTWTIDGAERRLAPRGDGDSIRPLHTRPSGLRIVYTRIGADAFTRVLEQQPRDGEWTAISESACRRAI